MTAISPTRQEDYPEWFQQVANYMAENSPVRGCMVIKPWGYGVWENIQRHLDARIKEMGHENAYFPLFIPLSFLEKEAKHVEGFAKECAVVTHHRLEEKDGKLVPVAPLEEPLVVRPTSEMIIGESFSRWVESWRDLPLLINQWANVVRWEMRPRILLRTTEFLWQEGHTVHASEKEAREETLAILEMYRSFIEDVLAIPLIVGEKPECERFPGAVATYTMEAMMQDNKALQAGTSHYLGQNFAKAQNIRFNNQNGEMEYGYTTSWGVTTRLLGGIIMVHGDDDGLRIPPKIAHKQVVILPITPKPESAEQVIRYAEELASILKKEGVAVQVDKRDKRGGEKNWEWIKKGVPMRLEVGPKDLEAGMVTVARRDKPHKDKQTVSKQTLAVHVKNTLEEMHKNYFEQAKAYRDANIRRDISSFEEMRAFFTEKNAGFVLGKWCGETGSEKVLDDLKVTIRCLPIEQSGTKGKCLLTGKESTIDVIYAKSY